MRLRLQAPRRYFAQELALAKGEASRQLGHLTDPLSVAARGMANDSGTTKKRAICSTSTGRHYRNHIVVLLPHPDGQGALRCHRGIVLPRWHDSLDDLSGNIAFMTQQCHKPIVVIEIAYTWRPGNYVEKSTSRKPP
jgi:hypothetical protein